MDLPSRYEDDVFAWSQHQAALLRGLRQSGLALPNDLDLEHVAEEIEDVGASELNSVRSHLRQVLAHLVKVASAPEAPPARKWLVEVVTQRGQAGDRFERSMRDRVPLDDIWRAAVRDAAQALAVYGDAMRPMPEECPYDLDTLLDDRRPVEELVAVLTAAAP